MKKLVSLNIVLLIVLSCSQSEYEKNTPELCTVYDYHQAENYSQLYYSDGRIVIVSSLSKRQGELEHEFLSLQTLDISGCSGEKLVQKDSLTLEEIDSEINQFGLRKIEELAVTGEPENDVNSFFKRSYQITSINEELIKVLINGREENSVVEVSIEDEITSFDIDDGFNYELYHLESDIGTYLVVQLWRPNSSVQLFILRV